MIEKSTIGKIVLSLIGGTSLAGCASIDSRPMPITSPAEAETIFKSCNRGIATELIDSAKGQGTIASNAAKSCRNATTTKAARNNYITAAMDLIDARYSKFTMDLSRESKGSNLGFNFLALVATAGASVASETTANDLATGATALLGTRDAFNKDALYEKTIGALVDEMFALRANARAALLTGLGKDYDKYPIEQAARDIAAYDGAADLNRAVQRMIKGAAQRADEADGDEKDLKRVLQGCVPEKNTFVARSRIRNFFEGLPNDAAGTAKIESIAQALGVYAKGTSRSDYTAAIFDVLTKQACSLDAMQEIVGTWDASINLRGN